MLISHPCYMWCLHNLCHGAYLLLHLLPESCEVFFAVRCDTAMTVQRNVIRDGIAFLPNNITYALAHEGE